MENGVKEAEDKTDDLLSVADLVRMTAYDPSTGVLVWRSRRKYLKASIGDQVGSPDRLGYWRVRIEGRIYQVHRLIWLYAYGQWPDKLVDHSNGNTSDNRLCNLRLATRSENAANKKRHANGASGFKGVSYHRATGLWQAQIMVGGKKKYLGVYSTTSAAHNAYLEAAKAMFKEFARAA